MKQCKFYDIENDTYLGGLLDDNNNELYCACCGAHLEKDEVCFLDEKRTENHFFIITEVYDNWVPLSDEIIGN